MYMVQFKPLNKAELNIPISTRHWYIFKKYIYQPDLVFHWENNYLLHIKYQPNFNKLINYLIQITELS